MHLKTDFDFFPALRDISCTPEMIALKTRNDKRLRQAKSCTAKVYRSPQNCPECGSWFWGFPLFKLGVCPVCEEA